jgi:hypothetical protein
MRQPDRFLPLRQPPVTARPDVWGTDAPLKGTLHCGSIVLDFDRNTLHVGRRTIRLASLGFDPLEFLARLARLDGRSAG